MSTLNEMMDKGKETLAKVPGNSNWSNAYTLSGEPAGARFFCPTCRLRIPYDAPEQVFHCGAFEKRPLVAGTAEQQKAERTQRVRFI